MNTSIPNAFIWRRLHSLTGIFFALFLIEHLLVNSQAALFLEEEGSGFVRAVNSIHNLPYLPLIEIFLLGVPIAFHAFWGILILRTGQINSFSETGNTPYLAEYSRNKAYSWQRITSWILLVGVLAHVIQMRFIEEPLFIEHGGRSGYVVILHKGNELPALATRFNVELLDQSTLKEELPRSLKQGEVAVLAPDFGTAELLVVRKTFKDPVMIALYTLFVLAACFHGFNGLWSAMIKWGVTLSVRSQAIMLKVSTGLMCLVALMGLMAIWGSYWSF